MATNFHITQYSDALLPSAIGLSRARGQTAILFSAYAGSAGTKIFKPSGRMSLTRAGTGKPVPYDMGIRLIVRNACGRDKSRPYRKEFFPGSINYYLLSSPPFSRQPQLFTIPPSIFFLPSYPPTFLPSIFSFKYQYLFAVPEKKTGVFF